MSQVGVLAADRKFTVQNDKDWDWTKQASATIIQAKWFQFNKARSSNYPLNYKTQILESKLQGLSSKLNNIDSKKKASATIIWVQCFRFNKASSTYYIQAQISLKFKSRYIES